VLENKSFPDGCFPCTWTIDLHEPDSNYGTDFKGSEFISISKHKQVPSPYWAPYRSLYSRNITNLFMAGRNISVTHQALGTVRVMRTTGMMGEVVGLAASLCTKYQILPRQVFLEKLDEFSVLRQGVPGTPPAPEKGRPMRAGIDMRQYCCLNSPTRKDWLMTTRNHDGGAMKVCGVFRDSGDGCRLGGTGAQPGWLV
jgi:hypothetical protein